MHHLVGTFVIGAIAGALGGRSASLRPAMRGLVKGGIIARRQVESATATARREMAKLVAEARADLNQETEQHS